MHVETVYCAISDPDRPDFASCVEVAVARTETGTPLCRSCKEAYKLGLKSPGGWVKSIDEVPPPEVSIPSFTLVDDDVPCMGCGRLGCKGECAR